MAVSIPLLVKPEGQPWLAAEGKTGDRHGTREPVRQTGVRVHNLIISEAQIRIKSWESHPFLSQCITESSMCNETILSGKEGATVTFILPSPTGLGVGFPVRLNSVFLGALVTLPLLLAVFPAEVLLDARQVAQGSPWVVVDAALLRTYIHLLPHLLLVRPLLQLPWQVVPPPVELQVLVSLEPLVADFADKSVCRHEGFRRESDDLGIRIWCAWEAALLLGGIGLRVRV